MPVQSLPGMLRFGTRNDPLWIDFDRRIGPYEMVNNHYHIEYEIYYLFRGERNFFLKDSVYHIRSGDLMLIDSYAVHKTSERSEPDHERIVLHFAPSFFGGFPREEKELLLSPFGPVQPLVRLNLQERRHVETLLGSLLAELSERPPGYTLHIRNMAAELLLFAARRLRKQESSGPADELSPVQRKVTDIVRHLNQHYGESLQLDTVARQFYISKSHLSRVFKEVTGFGFTEYVNITRIKEAERLLAETDWSITRVSEHCGFDNFSHFGKMFKKLSGLSPRAYRKLNRPGG
ncbi:helix-turn-helix domain-containing protein [Paenibacillus caseinilyticus]|uniref:AraC family transcriptional regulator n=1 Tax=Paenibacillus mucilaginosus K02 TaxID=997761 RepID=I0BG87_9BACL|nr:AraC family transcriptional regulator [Paenibacillus mucilaginosus]AFH61384.1 AraC family transcriptional regulator [Paenibacillus mucilaginosus K02]